MKTKYVVVLTVEMDRRLTKKAVREWLLDVVEADLVAEFLNAKVRVRSVDED